MARCFITRTLPGASIDRLTAAGHQLDIWPERMPPTPAELVSRTAEAEGLLCMLTDEIDAGLLDSAPDLKVVSNMAVGCDNIDLIACRERGIDVGNTPGVLTDATADLTLSLMLALARRLPEGMSSVRSGEWKTWSPDFLLGMELRDRTLGIIGTGRIGSAVSARAIAFGMEVVESGRPDGPTPGLPLAELLAQADIVSLHCPLTEETRWLVDAEFLSKMQSHALLINTSRGQVVDQIALATALSSGTIAGAALDVTDPEPLPSDDPILMAPNLIVTPHLGSATNRTREAMASIAVDNLLAGLEGRPLPHPVT
ncbi:MAG: D-glycerate dehydrogenase [Solirubrobacterales bacterium]|nr:D-glycerate dehydrogenase [Solirubrobacterales bacterium]